MGDGIIHFLTLSCIRVLLLNLKESDKVVCVQSSPRWAHILKTGTQWILVQNPEIAHGQDERSKFNTKNRKLAWLSCALHRKVLVWKFHLEKRPETLCSRHTGFCGDLEGLLWPIYGRLCWRKMIGWREIREVWLIGTLNGNIDSYLPLQILPTQPSGFNHLPWPSLLNICCSCLHNISTSRRKSSFHLGNTLIKVYYSVY